jgi:hypothetical protein
MTAEGGLAGVRREPGEINDHRPGEIRGTEFGLSPSNMKGVLGNEGALPLSGRSWTGFTGLFGLGEAAFSRHPANPVNPVQE